MLAVKPGKRRAAEPSGGLAHKLLDLVKERPMASGGVALSALLVVLRNPQILTAVLRAVIEALPAAAASAVVQTQVKRKKGWFG